MPAQNPIAHVKQLPSGEWQEHSLEEHLKKVASRADSAAAQFGNGDWGFLAGVWHDLGKYKPDFQSYIRAASGYRADAHLEEEDGPGKNAKVDHSTAGAIHALQRHPGVGKVLAYLIAGHHSGLPDWLKDKADGRGLEERVREIRHLEESKIANIPADILDAKLPTSPLPPNYEHAHLWIRMLFSCLVDADFLDTEEFMDPGKAALRGSAQSLSELRDLFSQSMTRRDLALQATGAFDLDINQIRREVLDACKKAAQKEPGFFSLTVPTGGGKTLSSLAFALEHALIFGKRRIIFAIPYTSIIEQTAQTFASIFGEENVLEHHSNLEFERETPKGRLASENWDAPIVVTTNVQLFESLFASRTSRCRKLHNIANSVIVLDEAQMLPPEKLAPTLSVLRGLVEGFGVSVVLCTATQPALEGAIGSGSSKFLGLEKVKPIIENPNSLSGRLKRVELEMKGTVKISWPTLADEISQQERVLCIVNRRQDCRDLWESLKELVPEKPVHLSALMCGEHRSKVIRHIKANLKENKPIRVVSTQLVEAGVDIDFPIVYRAMAGLDSLAQAAGRCNREGRLNLEGKLGKVIVFNPPKESPAGLLRKGEYAGAEILRLYPELARSLAPEAFLKYFQCFYSKVIDFGKEEFKNFFLSSVESCQFQFRSAALWYTLIEEQGYKDIVVWYQDEEKNFSSRKLLEDVRFAGPARDRMRRLQRCTVKVPERVWRTLRDQGSIQEVVGPEGPIGLWAQGVDNLYDETFGLKLEGPEDFIC